MHEFKPCKQHLKYVSVYAMVHLDASHMNTCAHALTENKMFVNRGCVHGMAKRKGTIKDNIIFLFCISSEKKKKKNEEVSLI